MEFFAQPECPRPLGDLLIDELNRRDPPWLSMTAGVAFAKQSGVRFIADALRRFADSGGLVRLVVGIDHRGTSTEGLRLLLSSAGPLGEIRVLHNEAAVTFHPKVYLFERDDEALAIIGSGNLTAGGLYTNYEAAVLIPLDPVSQRDEPLLKSLHAAFSRWQDENSPVVRRLDEAFLSALESNGYTVPEFVASDDADEGAPAASVGPPTGLFGRISPRLPARRRAATRRTSSRTAPDTTPSLVGTSFVMTLQRTDVGMGQTTPGTSQRSPEIFIPLGARDQFPAFWGWDTLFEEDSRRPGKFDRQGVRMRLGVQDISVNMMTWPDKHDFRLRNAPLRSAGRVGDILRLEFSDGNRGFDYLVEIIPQGTRRYGDQLALCTKAVRGSKKRYGYY